MGNEILPHYKEPYQPSSIMECQQGFERCSLGFVSIKFFMFFFYGFPMGWTQLKGEYVWNFFLASNMQIQDNGLWHLVGKKHVCSCFMVRSMSEWNSRSETETSSFFLCQKNWHFPKNDMKLMAEIRLTSWGWYFIHNYLQGFSTIQTVVFSPDFWTINSMKLLWIVFPQGGGFRVGFHLVSLPQDMFWEVSPEQWKNPWLVVLYRWWKTTQLYRDYKKPLKGSL